MRKIKKKEKPEDLGMTGKNLIEAREYNLKNRESIERTGERLSYEQIMRKHSNLFNSFTVIVNVTRFCAFEIEKDLFIEKKENISLDPIWELSNKIDGREDNYSVVGTRMNVSKNQEVKLGGESCDAIEFSFFFNENKEEILFAISLCQKEKKTVVSGMNMPTSIDFKTTVGEFWKKTDKKLLQ